MSGWGPSGREVDFIAVKDGRTECYQVCLTMLNDATFEREMCSLKAIRDNYPKTVLSLDRMLIEAPEPDPPECRGLAHRQGVIV